jgi:hypothetical protein
LLRKGKIKCRKTTPQASTANIGDDAVVMGRVPDNTNVGKGAVVILPNQPNGSIILNNTMAVGRGAEAGNGSQAIGAGARAGVTEKSSATLEKP